MLKERVKLQEQQLLEEENIKKKIEKSLEVKEKHISEKEKNTGRERIYN